MYARPGKKGCIMSNGAVRGSGEDLKSKREVISIETGLGEDRIDNEGSHRVTTVCKEDTRILSGVECASMSTEG